MYEDAFTQDCEFDPLPPLFTQTTLDAQLKGLGGARILDLDFDRGSTLDVFSASTHVVNSFSGRSGWLRYNGNNTFERTTLFDDDEFEEVISADFDRNADRDAIGTCFSDLAMLENDGSD